MSNVFVVGIAARIVLVVVVVLRRYLTTTPIRAATTLNDRRYFLVSHIYLIEFFE